MKGLYIGFDCISVHWYWNFSSGVLENCLWSVSKPEIWMFFPHRFVKVLGEGAGWSFVISMGMEEFPYPLTPPYLILQTPSSRPPPQFPWQLQTPNRHPHYNLPQTCGGIKSVSLVWIRPTDNYLTCLRTSFSINELWYYQIQFKVPSLPFVSDN